jgi:formylglycine-generating enzyme
MARGRRAVILALYGGAVLAAGCAKLRDTPVAAADGGGGDDSSTEVITSPLDAASSADRQVPADSGPAIDSPVVVAADASSSQDGQGTVDAGAVLDSARQDVVVPGGNLPPGCQQLPATCGQGDNEDCCTSVLVPGGSFNRINDSRYPATVSAFRLDKFEVTVGRFRVFVASGHGTQALPPPPGAGAHPRIAGSGWQPEWNRHLQPTTGALQQRISGCGGLNDAFTPQPGPHENRPMGCQLDWHLAFAFCAWDDGRLPTDAEWNYAAAGGEQQRPFPWGTTIDASYASYAVPGLQCMGDGKPGCSVDDFVKVGSMRKGVARWGHTDMAGNVTEWTLDYALEKAHFPLPCVDCANLTMTSPWRIGRGGSAHDQEHNVTTTAQGSFEAPPPSPLDTSYVLGVRCARAP